MLQSVLRNNRDTEPPSEFRAPIKTPQETFSRQIPGDTGWRLPSSEESFETECQVEVLVFGVAWPAVQDSWTARVERSLAVRKTLRSDAAQMGFRANNHSVGHMILSDRLFRGRARNATRRKSDFVKSEYERSTLHPKIIHLLFTLYTLIWHRYHKLAFCKDNF